MHLVESFIIRSGEHKGDILLQRQVVLLEPPLVAVLVAPLVVQDAEGGLLTHCAPVLGDWRLQGVPSFHHDLLWGVIQHPAS